MTFASLDLRKENLESFLKCLPEIRKARFDGVEIALWEDMRPYATAVREELDKNGLSCNVHCDRLLASKGVASYTNTLMKNIDFAREVDAKSIIAHPIKPYSQNKRESRRLLNDPSLPRNLLVETVAEMTYADNKQFGRGLVLDVGNIHHNREWDLLENYAPLTRLVHLHDTREGLDHYAFGKEEGTLDIDRIVRAFKGNDYTIEIGRVFRRWEDVKDDQMRSIDALNNALMRNGSFGKNARLDHLKRTIDGNYLQKAIEFGCGEGYLLHNTNAQVKTGYDLSPKETFNDLTYVKIDLETGRTPEKDADLVICSEVIEHLADDTLAIQGMYQSLREGGLVFLSTINKNCGSDKSEQDKRYGHHRRYDTGLARLMENAGFKTIDLYGFRGPHYYAAKKEAGRYDVEKDVIRDDGRCSGLVYIGVKGK